MRVGFCTVRIANKSYFNLTASVSPWELCVSHQREVEYSGAHSDPSLEMVCTTYTVTLLGRQREEDEKQAEYSKKDVSSKSIVTL